MNEEPPFSDKTDQFAGRGREKEKKMREMSGGKLLSFLFQANLTFLVLGTLCSGWDCATKAGCGSGKGRSTQTSAHWPRSAFSQLLIGAHL